MLRLRRTHLPCQIAHPPTLIMAIDYNDSISPLTVEGIHAFYGSFGHDSLQLWPVEYDPPVQVERNHQNQYSLLRSK